MANLFIGIGGSGVKTMTALKEQLKSYDAAASDNSRFLMIDTDQNELDKFDNHEKLDLGDVNVYQYYSQAVGSKVNKTDDQIRFMEWFDTKALATISNGPFFPTTPPNRPKGRAAAAIKQIPFREKITSILSELLSMKEEGPIDEEVKVYTCCSVAGGTGSSVYLDLMYLLQDVYAGINTTGGELQLWSFLYMPEIFKIFQYRSEKVTDDFQTNVFAFWSEINAISKDYYQKVMKPFSEFEPSRDFNQNVFKPFSVFVSDRDFRWKIFKNAVLIDCTSSNNKIFKAKEMYENTANLIRYLLDNQIGNHLRSDWDNSTNRLASFSKDEKWIDSFSIVGFREFDNKINDSVEDFVSETPYLFPSHCQNSNTEGRNIWLSNNKEDINQIRAAGYNNITSTTLKNTILIKFKQGISFDDYPEFENYKYSYYEKKKNSLSSFYPHIHKDFYKEDDLNVFFNNPLKFKKEQVVILKEKAIEIANQIKMLEQDIITQEQAIQSIK